MAVPEEEPLWGVTGREDAGRALGHAELCLRGPIIRSTLCVAHGRACRQEVLKDEGIFHGRLLHMAPL